MNKIVIVFYLLICQMCLLFGQDTVFHKIERRYESIVIRDGYHLICYLKQGNKIDSVFQYQYGAYMKTHIVDIVVHDNNHIFLYDSGDALAYSIHHFDNGRWSPLMGNVLVFFTRTRKKVDASIVKGKRFRLVEEDGRETILKINFVNKTLEPYDK